ncbi:prefoldin subunit [Candidatus Micrarchaeota archaeon]|nr:prefoldin subunit [Candidatus Micrarchaeota archaeon]
MSEIKNMEATDLTKALGEYENLEKQLEMLLLQRNQLKLQLGETKNAQEELRHATGEIYKSAGSLVLKTTKENAEKELKERKELIEIKLNAIQKEEEKMRIVLKELQESLQEQMKKYGQAKKK